MYIQFAITNPRANSFLEKMQNFVYVKPYLKRNIQKVGHNQREKCLNLTQNTYQKEFSQIHPNNDENTTS